MTGAGAQSLKEAKMRRDRSSEVGATRVSGGKAQIKRKNERERERGSYPCKPEIFGCAESADANKGRVVCCAGG